MMQLLDKSGIWVQRKRQFLLGTMLTWIPFLFFTLSLNDVGRAHQEPVGAMFTSIFYRFPLISFSIGLGVEVAALTLLVRGFIRADILQSILFALNIACNLLMIFLFGITLAVCLLAVLHVQPGLAIRAFDLSATALRGGVKSMPVRMQDKCRSITITLVDRGLANKRRKLAPKGC